MPALVWDQTEDRTFETGVSKGVLYDEDGNAVVWNGITAVDEIYGGESEPIFFDGVKINDIVTIGDFAATLRAITYPDEFSRFEGLIEDQIGFYVGQQRPSRFSLCYRTEIGDGVSGNNAGYKLHLLYNLTAMPSDRSYSTISDSVTPVEFEWEITSIPEEIDNFLPTAHVIINSRRMDPYLLQDIEDILYGTDENDPHLPSLQSLATFVRNWDRLIVIDNGDGTWTASSTVPDIISMLDEDTFQIISDTAVFIDADSYTIESTEKNEGDIWLP